MPQRVRRALKLAVFSVIIVVIAFVVVLPMGIAYFYVYHMVNRDCGNLPTPMNERLTDTTGLQAFTFAPEPGLVLDAWYQPGTNAAGIVILPGAYGGSNTMYHEFKFLHEAGYSVMTYDTRTCANPPHRTTLGYAETADLSAAVDWLEQQPEIERIGVIGYSMGGATAIMGAAIDSRIQAVVATGNYGDLATDIRRDNRERGLFERWMRGWIVRFYEWETGVDVDQARPVNLISHISPRAVFLIHGSREFKNNRTQQQFDNAGEPKALWIVEGAGHGGYIDYEPEEYPRRIIEFFDTYMSSANE